MSPTNPEPGGDANRLNRQPARLPEDLAADAHRTGIQQFVPVLTSVSLFEGKRAIDNFLARSNLAKEPLPEELRFVITRERRIVDKELLAHDDPERRSPRLPGPVQAILVDPIIPLLHDDNELAARVLEVLSAVSSDKPGRSWAAPAMIALAVPAVLLLYLRLVSVAMLLPVAGVLAMIALAVEYFRKDRVSFGRYPALDYAEALALARLRRDRNDCTPVVTSSTDHPVQAVETSPRRSERDRRISEVHAAIAELDKEWLDYQLDLHAWYFAKPQLRNIKDPVIKTYQDAYAALREQADDLTSASPDHRINAAQAAARTALKTWGEANNHALAIGVTTLSPSEEAALARLRALVAQLNDRATPQTQWQKLVSEITKNLAKLSTVPVTLADIGRLPVIEAESRLRALTPPPTPQA